MPVVRKVRREEVLFSPGDLFCGFYLVRCGTFKSVLRARDGREQVTGFPMTGELLGMDGLAQGKHASAAVALEDSEVVDIACAPSRLGEVSHAVPTLLSREIMRAHKLMLLLGGGMDAGRRLAAFLLNQAWRMEARGYSGSEFHLRMTRADIGSYLGLTLETVSRTFSSFQQRGLLRVDGRHVLRLDRAALTRLFDRTDP